MTRPETVGAVERERERERATLYVTCKGTFEKANVPKRREKLNRKVAVWKKQSMAKKVSLNYLLEPKKFANNNYFTNSFTTATGITLIALVVTIIFSYDEKLKCSNSKVFLLKTI